MSAAAPLPATEPQTAPLTEPQTGAVIDSASVGAGHDGEAELIVRLIHPNGAAETVTLDAELGFHLMNNCGVSDAAGLAGQPWRKILEGL